MQWQETAIKTEFPCAEGVRTPINLNFVGKTHTCAIDSILFNMRFLRILKWICPNFLHDFLQTNGCPENYID